MRPNQPSTYLKTTKLRPVPTRSFLQPIPTKYKGHTFRSRLEAKWAMFFTLLGARWQYEPEGFDLGGVWYLPDFAIDGYRWFEIKPGHIPWDAKFSKFEAILTREDAMRLTCVLSSIPTRRDSMADTPSLPTWDWPSKGHLLSGDPLQVLQGQGHFCPSCFHPFLDIEVQLFCDNCSACSMAEGMPTLVPRLRRTYSSQIAAAKMVREHQF
jgi:hypothetical protein